MNEPPLAWADDIPDDAECVAGYVLHFGGEGGSEGQVLCEGTKAECLAAMAKKSFAVHNGWGNPTSAEFFLATRAEFEAMSQKPDVIPIPASREKPRTHAEAIRHLRRVK